MFLDLDLEEMIIYLEIVIVIVYLYLRISGGDDHASWDWEYSDRRSQSRRAGTIVTIVTIAKYHWWISITIAR